MKFWKLHFDIITGSYIHFDFSRYGVSFELFGYIIGIDF